MVRAEEVFAKDMAEHAAAITAVANELTTPFTELVKAASKCLSAGGKLLFFGNGGSAADAQHLATEFIVRYRETRTSLAALALTTDTSVLTAAGNDFGFEHVFSRQIAGLGRKGDLAIGISTSGNSPNVIRALNTAREMGLITAGFGGGAGGKLRQSCDIYLIVPSYSTARIQECHILLGHMLCAAIDAEYTAETAN